MKGPLASALFATALFATGAHAQEPPRPRVMLWAWERPEDLRFLAQSAPAQRPGVAFLSRTVHLAGGEVREELRRQRLLVPEGTYLVAVVRVEGARRYPSAAHSVEQRGRVVAAARAAASLPDVRAVQIDYDSVPSERAFHRALLASVRAALPPATGLSMTALASWCAFDRWIDEPALPVQYTVPMLFTMGARGTREIADFVAREHDLASARCSTDVGYAVHEPVIALRAARRVWLFNPAPWNATQYAAVAARWSTPGAP